MVTRGDTEVEIDLFDGDPDCRAWAWWDPVDGGSLIVVDRYGNVASPVRSETEVDDA